MPGYPGQISTSSSAGQLVVTWASQSTGIDGTTTDTAQLVLDKSGDMQFNYGAVRMQAPIIEEIGLGLNPGLGLSLQGMSLGSLPVVVDNNKALWFDLAVGKRINVHSRLWPVAVFLIFSVAAIVFGFSALLGWMIDRPLARLRLGLGSVDEGRLDVRLDTRSRDQFEDIADGFNKMIRSLDNARHRYDEQVELMEREITFRTVEAAKKIDAKLLSKDQVFETKLREIVTDNIGDFDFQVSDLADQMAVSTRQLHRRVVDLTAQTPASLVRSLRLEHAHHLLQAGAANVSGAAYQSGFKDVSYFSQLFQKKYGQLPSAVIPQ